MTDLSEGYPGGPRDGKPRSATTKGVKAPTDRQVPGQRPMDTEEFADIAAFYDGFARVYRGAFHTRTRMLETGGIVSFLGNHCRHRGLAREQYTILSAGCGTGLEVVELAQQGYGVSGIDLSESMLAAARAHARDAGVVVDLYRGNLLELEKSLPRTFDAVICLGNVLAYFLSDEDLKLALRALRRALKPDGILIADTMNFGLLRSLDDKTQAFAFDAPEGGTVRGRLVFQFSDDRVTCTPQITDGNQSCGDRSVSLHPIPTEKMTRFMKEAEFTKVDVHFTSIDSVSYDARSSSTIFYVAFT